MENMENKIQKVLFWISVPMFLYYSIMKHLDGNIDLVQVSIGMMVFAVGARIFTAQTTK